MKEDRASEHRFTHIHTHTATRLEALQDDLQKKKAEHKQGTERESATSSYVHITLQHQPAQMTLAKKKKKKKDEASKQYAVVSEESRIHDLNPDTPS